MSSPRFLDIVKTLADDQGAIHFQKMIYATSRAYTQYDGPLLTVQELAKLGSLAGHQFLVYLDEKLKPAYLAKSTIDHLRIMFLWIFGTILAVGYAGVDSAGTISELRQTFSLMQSHLCQILAHYLVYLGSQLGLLIQSGFQQFFLQAAPVRWLREGRYEWNSQVAYHCLATNTIGLEPTGIDVQALFGKGKMVILSSCAAAPLRRDCHGRMDLADRYRYPHEPSALGSLCRGWVTKQSTAFLDQEEQSQYNEGILPCAESENLGSTSLKIDSGSGRHSRSKLSRDSPRPLQPLGAYCRDGLLDIVGDGEGQVDHQSVSMSSKKKARSARPRVTAVSLLHVSHLQNLTDVGLGMYAMYNVSQVSIRLYEVFPFR